MGDNKEKVLNDANQLLRNVKRFYGDIFYFETDDSKDDKYLEIHKVTEDFETNKVNDKNGVYSITKNKTQNEVDLFGNVINQKEAWEFSQSLDELNSQICECQKCPLGKSRTKFVFGVGNPKADLVFIGEAPGADEDMKGEPFVGRAGQLLNKILEAVGLKREDVYICNILKCRPPGNRNPMPDEINKCEPYLKYQLELIKPLIIIALGRIAAETLLKSKQPLLKLRGKVHSFNDMNLMVTFHPAALLRNPQWKRPAWEDMQQIKKMYDELKSK
jgi:DNA polymerase